MYHGSVRPPWLVLLAGCAFHRGAGAAPDGAVGGDAARDAAADGSIDAVASACGGKVWFADFSTDPTTQDLNGDGVDDWALRDGTAFPTSQLANGVWSNPAVGKPLDTQPKQDFTTRVVVHVRLRDTGVGGAYGAVFWINVGYQSNNSFAPLFVGATLQANNTQTLEVHTKTVTGVETTLAQKGGYPPDFIDVDLDIDPQTLEASYAAPGLQGSSMLMRQPPGTATDKWATVIAYDGSADFDSVRVEVCPN